MVSLVKKSDDGNTDLPGRYCIKVNSDRTLQRANEEIFLALSQHAVSIPTIVVATKKDEFVDERKGNALNNNLCIDGDVTALKLRIEEYAEQELCKRQALIEKELLDVPGARLERLIAVSNRRSYCLPQYARASSRHWKSS